MARLTRHVPTHSVGAHRRRRRGAYPRARFREAERIARKGDVARLNNVIPYRYLPPAENDRFRFFRRGAVVDPCGRVDTRPYKAGGRRQASALPESGDGSRLTRRAPTHSVGTRRFFAVQV